MILFKGQKKRHDVLGWADRFGLLRVAGHMPVRCNGHPDPSVEPSRLLVVPTPQLIDAGLPQRNLNKHMAYGELSYILKSIQGYCQKLLFEIMRESTEFVTLGSALNIKSHAKRDWLQT